jgi:transmembrane sensor
MSSRPERTAPGVVERALHEPERAPLATVLDTELPEARVPEIWHRIDARLSFKEGVGARRAPIVWLVAASFLFLLLTRSWLHRAPVAAGLALEGGAAPTVLRADTLSGTFAFTDGSHLEVAPRTELRVVKNDAHTLVTALARGRITFDVRPGGPRRWLVEAGPAVVEVVGTRFTVGRDDGTVRVEVERGIVLVRSETLAGGSVRLTAGQSVLVTKNAVFTPRAPAPSSAEPLARSKTAPPAASNAAPIALSALPALPATSPSPAEANAAARDVPDAVDRALATADAARRRGDSTEAAQALEGALTAARPNDKRRGLAALSLARLVVRNDPARAARVLRDAFGAMPADLLEDALARRVEAEGRSGRRDEAARLAEEYARRFPAGQRSSEVKRWSGE